MPHLMINDVRYFVESQGEGLPLVLLHGFTGSSASWAAHTAVLATTFRTITIDLLGHGRTASPASPHRYQMEQAAADIIAILKKIEAAPAHLLGYSMGGRLALYLAVNYPDWFRSLVLESASPGLATAVSRVARQQQDDELADWIVANSIAAFVERWEQLPLWDSQSQLPPEIRQSLRQQRLQNDPAGLANSLRGLGTGVQPSLWPRLSEIKMPVLLLAGELDSKFAAINEQMQAQIPHGELQIAAGAGHTIHLERPSLVHKLTRQFWQQM